MTETATIATNGEILIGDCRATLRLLPAGYFHCAMTSPPYWGLRSYLPKDHADKSLEIGSEQTPEAFIETMVDVFREVRRVLRNDGVLFVNLGDSYAASPGQRKTTDIVGPKQLTNTGSNTTGSRSVDGIPAGQLCNMPHRVAAALAALSRIFRSTPYDHPRPDERRRISGSGPVTCRVLAKARRSVHLRSRERRPGVC